MNLPYYHLVHVEFSGVYFEVNMEAPSLEVASLLPRMSQQGISFKLD